MKYQVRFFEGSSIFFVNSKQYAEKFAKMLYERNMVVEILTSDMSPEDRKAVMSDFRSGKIRILFSTNLIARGIDNRMVCLVVNFDLPFNFNYGGQRQHKEKTLD